MLGRASGSMSLRCSIVSLSSTRSSTLWRPNEAGRSLSSEVLLLFPGSWGERGVSRGLVGWFQRTGKNSKISSIHIMVSTVYKVLQKGNFVCLLINKHSYYFLHRVVQFVNLFLKNYTAIKAGLLLRAIDVSVCCLFRGDFDEFD